MWSDEVDRKAKQYCRDHQDVPYERAVEVVLDADEDLKIRYVLGE